MTATLTRRQSETVRKRIRSLNETLKRKRKESAGTPRRPDVRDIFPAQQPTRICEEPRKDNATAPSSDNNNFITLESIAQEGLNKACAKEKHDRDSVFDCKSNEYSPRRLPEMITKMFYTPELEGKAPSNQSLQRPPAPRKSHSEGVYKILGVQELERDRHGRAKLDKTASEGSPVRSIAGEKMGGN